jgi:hypothetical protein
MLVKITTGVVYLGILGLLLVGRFAADERRGAAWKRYALFALHALIVPTLIGLAWTKYADSVKAQNALTADFLTSKPLHDWYYGTWQQKTTLSTWVKLWDRTAAYGFGTAASPAAGLALAAFGSRRPYALASCLAAVIGAFAVFTNLHDFHDYYQYATTLLVIVMVGFGFAAAESWLPRGRLLLPLLGAAIVLKSIEGYTLDYRTRQAGNESVVEVGNFVKTNTSPAALIVVHGDDWSSLLPYYSQRRALMNRWNHPATHPALRTALERSAAVGNKVEAVVFCHGDRGNGDGRAEALLGHPPTCTPFSICDVCR